MSHLNKLLDAAEPPSAPDSSEEGQPIDELQRAPWHEITTRFPNGAYAFASALHFFGIRRTEADCDIIAWNDANGWRRHYSLPGEGTFFAEDLFGNQFGMFPRGRVARLDVESGGLDWVANSLNEWAEVLIDNHREQTAWPLGQEWQEEFGPLPEGYRLVPRHPFILGGEYEIDNLVAAPRENVMEFVGQLAAEVVGLPDGETVTLDGWQPASVDESRPFLLQPPAQ